MNGLLKLAKHLHMKHHNGHKDYADEAFNLMVSGGEHVVDRHKKKRERKK